MNVALISSKGGHLGQMKIIFTNEVIGNSSAILITEDNRFIGVRKNSFLGKFPTYFFKKDELLRLNPILYLKSFFRIRKILRAEKIDMIVTNGAQLSIPAVLAARSSGIKTIFIDTIVRVNTPNWSAKFCYYFSNIFIVQHKSMCKKYGSKAIYRGSIL